jgi:endonuclease/exonuclease/phosphatase (EEP) superfamily protein YafD
LLRRLTFAALFFGLLVASIVLGFSFLNHWLALADSVSHFRVHICLALVAICLIAFALRAWNIAATAVLAVSVGTFSIYPAWPLSSPHESLTKPLKLIQFNTLFNNPTPERSLLWIKTESPDFVMLQEVSQSNARTIYDGLAETMPYGLICKFATVGGVAVRSKFPMLNQGCTAGQGLVWLLAEIDGKKMSFASAHLHWPYPFQQWRQIERLQAALKGIPRPVILTGDFNAAAWSETAQRVAAATDTHVVSGLRFTLRMGPRPIGPIPFLPIDQVLVPNEVTVGDIHLGPAIGSDHLPVVTVFELR